MNIISKNRWVAPMLSVLLVCIVGVNVVQATGSGMKLVIVNR